MRQLNIEDCFISAHFANQCQDVETVTITPKRKVSFPSSRRNWWKTASLNRLKMPVRKSSVISKVITIESDFIRTYDYKSPMQFENGLKLKNKIMSRESLVS